MTHIDLFSGIGGFSLAFDRVFNEQKNKHIFVEWDDFCQEVLKKHWPESEYHKDIHQFIAYAKSSNDRGNTRELSQENELETKERQEKRITKFGGSDCILTGGFPCQPFSQAGRRKGTDDDRYLWPAMFECITLFRPEWVIAENVAGLVTWNEGLVLETVCSDLEREGYEVQPFVIPACAVGAPHRRDRVWIIAQNTLGKRSRRGSEMAGQVLERKSPEAEIKGPDSKSRVTNSKRKGHKGHEHKEGQSARHSGRPQWDTHWFEVATRLCRVDDGIPRRMDRNPRLKALGNAIVPQVAEEIFKAIKSTFPSLNKEEIAWIKNLQ